MATGWFQRASSVFNRTEPAPQPFDVGCDCGTRLQGERAESSLKPRCPTCGTQVFVLPATPYPLPAALQRRAPERTDSASRGSQTEKVPAAPKPRKSKPAATPQDQPARTPGPTWQARGEQIVRRLQNWCTPVRLVGVAIALGLVLTTAVVYRKARWDHALFVLQGSIDRGEAAVKARDFPTALAEYRSAAAALDILGRRDAAARDIRCTRDAVEVVASRAANPLLPALRDWLQGKPTNSFPLADRGWLVFDGSLIPSGKVADDAPETLLFDVPIVIDGIPVDVVIPLPTWSRYVTAPQGDQPRRVIFAAQIERADRPAGDRKEVRVWLHGPSARLWTNADVYRVLESDLEDEASQAETTALIEQQRQFLEETP